MTMSPAHRSRFETPREPLHHSTMALRTLLQYSFSTSVAAALHTYWWRYCGNLTLPTRHRKQQILVIRNRLYKADPAWQREPHSARIAAQWWTAPSLFPPRVHRAWVGGSADLHGHLAQRKRSRWYAQPSPIDSSCCQRLILETCSFFRK